MAAGADGAILPVAGRSAGQGGEFWPVKRAIFEATYVLLEEQP